MSLVNPICMGTERKIRIKSVKLHVASAFYFSLPYVVTSICLNGYAALVIL